MAAAIDVGEISGARVILTSRHGEFSRTFSILESLAVENSVSPADFSLSVHHALIGLLSIAKNNKSGHTALAAGRESLFLGLIDAASCLIDNPNQDVLVVHYDEPLGGVYAPFDLPDSQPFAAALLLSAADGERLTMGYVPSPQGSGSDDLAADFVAFLSSKEPRWSTEGEAMKWHWTRHAEN